MMHPFPGFNRFFEIARHGRAILRPAGLFTVLIGWIAGACAPAVQPAAGGSAGGSGGGADAGLLYVNNQAGASVSVIDMGMLEVVRTIDLRDYGFSANAKPHEVVVEPDGSAWYVSLIGDNAVAKFSADGQLLGAAEMEVPGLLALHPGGELLYATHSMSVINPPATVGEIRRAEPDVEQIIEVLFPRPHIIEAHPGGEYVYTASLGVNQMASIEVETGEVELIRLEGPNPVLGHGAVAPDGSTMVITTLAGQLLVFDLADPATPRLADSIRVGMRPWLPAFGPDGRYVYVPNRGDNTVSVVDMERRDVVATIDHPAFAEPYAAIVSPDGSRVFVSNTNETGSWSLEGAAGDAAEAGNVVVIDAAANSVIKVIPIGPGPTGMAVAPAQ